MKAIKLVAILAMLLVSFSVRAIICPVRETTVVFINGVWTTKPEAIKHMEKLAKVSYASGISADCTHFDYSHTQDDGYTSDVAESIIQKSTEFAVNISELTRMLLHLITPDAIFGNLIDGVYARNVGEVVDTQLDKHLLKFRGITHIDDPDSAKRQRGIALTHSQGGLYGNALFGRLNPTEQLHTRLITVATPAQDVAGGGPNTRLSRDRVENLFFLNALASGLVSNTDRLCDTEIVAEGDSFLCHGFDTGYLHDLRAREQIVNDITKSLPSGTITGIVRNSDTARAGDATVSLFSSSGVLVAETTTRPITGTYRFGDIKVPCPNCFLKAKNQAGTVCTTVPIPLAQEGLYTIDVTLDGVCASPTSTQFSGTITNSTLFLTGFVPDSDSWVFTRGNYDTPDYQTWVDSLCLSSSDTLNLAWLTTVYSFSTGPDQDFTVTGVNLNDVLPSGPDECGSPGTFYLAVYDFNGSWRQRIFKGVLILHRIDATHWVGEAG